MVCVWVKVQEFKKYLNEFYMIKCDRTLTWTGICNLLTSELFILLIHMEDNWTPLIVSVKGDRSELKSKIENR